MLSSFEGVRAKIELKFGVLYSFCGGSKTSETRESREKPSDQEQKLTLNKLDTDIMSGNLLFAVIIFHAHQ